MSTLEYSQLLGNYGEFVGAIAIVVTLIYLAVQLKQNTALSKRPLSEPVQALWTRSPSDTVANGARSSLDFIGCLRTLNILDRVDPRRPSEIVNELHDDYKATIESFGSRYTAKVLAFAEHISNCHQKYHRFVAEESPTERMVEVRGFAYLTLDNTYTSMKLLMLGYLTPSGNMLRQSLEAACMCILLATDTSIAIGGKKGEIRFFEEYRRRKPIHEVPSRG